MRFEKVIYIRYIPLTAKIFKDFYMEEVSLAGIDVEYWDISALFFKHSAGQEDSSHLATTRKFNTYSELEAGLAGIKGASKTLFISIMTFEGRIGRLYRLFTRYNCTLGVFGRNMFPLAPGNKSSLLRRISGLNLSKVKNILLTKLVRRQKRNGTIKEYDILFLGGENGWQGVGNIDHQEVSRAEVVKVNSDDYDNFLRLKDAEPVISGDYILFLDEYLPLHPDAVIFKIRNVSPEQYYPYLIRYFERVERQYNLPVVIAAHPKAAKYKEEDYFGGRKVFFGKSAELSKFASFVLAHDSTSINYPVCFNKKLHFITSGNIEREINSVHRNVMHFAKYLDCNFQYFDREDEPIDIIDAVREEAYRRYRYDFQTSPETENILSKDIFIKFLRDE